MSPNDFRVTKDSVLTRSPYALVITLVFTAFWVQQSVHFGRYAYPVGLDDVTYLSDAMSRLCAWKEGMPLWKLYSSSPPHSPVYTYLAMVAFSLLGYMDWTPVALCGVFIFFACKKILAAFPAECPAFGVMAVLFFLTVPFSRHIVTDFRPDMVTGLALGYGGLIFVRSNWTQFPWKDWFQGGAVFGFALLLKPAYAPATLGLFCAAMGCSIMSGGLWVFFRFPLKVMRLGLVAVGGMLLLALPHFFWAWRQVYEYIHVNMFGSYKGMWNLRISIEEQLLYYFNGFGGQEMLGTAWIHITGCAVLCLLLACAQKDTVFLKKYGAYLLYSALAYVAVSATTYMSPFLGAAFFGTLLTGAMAAAAYIVRDGNRYVRVCLGFVLASYLVTVWCGAPDHRFFDREDAIVNNREMSRLVEDIHRFSLSERGAVVTTVENHFTGANISYELMRRYAQNINILDLHREPSLESALQAVEQVGVVITIANPLVAHLPSFAWLDELTARLNADSRFVCIGHYPLGLGDTTALLYVRLPLVGFNPLVMHAEGFGPLEGPYPQWELPRVRWARNEHPLLRIPPANKMRRLILEMRSAGPNMQVTIAVGQAEPREIRLPDPMQFVREELVIAPSDQETLVRMTISDPPKEALPHRVLFKSLLLVPEPLQSFSQYQ